jgi:hypothetical protein
VRPVHALASERHYVDHLAPVWAALDPEERGTFYAGSTQALARARQYGLEGLSPRVHRQLPALRACQLEGRQPWWLVASYADHRRAGGQRRTVYLEHGAGQSYLGDPLTGHRAHYAGGPGRDRVGLFLCPSETVAQLNRAAAPAVPAVAVGCPKLDALPLCAAGREPCAAVTFHWNAEAVAPEATTAFPHYRAALERLAAGGALPLLGHGHPRAWRQLSGWWLEHGVTTEQDLTLVLMRASVFVADNTSAMFEAAALDVPVVVLNAPQYRRHVQHGLRFWQAADIGLQVDDPRDLIAALTATLEEDPQAARRRQVAVEVYGPRDRQATARAVTAMRAHCP